jgi:hypothetical protein
VVVVAAAGKSFTSRTSLSLQPVRLLILSALVVLVGLVNLRPIHQAATVLLVGTRL